MLIDESNIRFKAVMSGKPGGQSANRRASKVQIWVKIDELPLSQAEKKRLREKLARHINRNGELEAQGLEGRSQELNKMKAIERANEMVEEALKVSPPRIPTKPPRSATEIRIRAKKIKSERKKRRKVKL